MDMLQIVCICNLPSVCLSYSISKGADSSLGIDEKKENIMKYIHKTT